MTLSNLERLQKTYRHCSTCLEFDVYVNVVDKITLKAGPN